MNYKKDGIGPMLEKLDVSDTVSRPCEGAIDHETTISTRDCNMNGPLVVYMAPTSDKGRLYAFGRLFSSTVGAGPKIRIQGRTSQRIVLMVGQFVEPIEDCPSGNIVLLASINSFSRAPPQKQHMT
jgi:elongation factor 2